MLTFLPRVDFPDLRYAPGFSVIAGLLLVPLSISGSDFIGKYTERPMPNSHCHTACSL